jgi:hypothetical protein
MKAKRDIQGLGKILASGQKINIRIEAARALGELGPDALVALDGCGHIMPSSPLYKPIIESLIKIGPPAVNSLCSYLYSDSDDKEIIEALAMIGAPAVIPVINLLKESAKWFGYNRGAVQVLEKIGAPALEPFLNSCLEGHFGEGWYPASSAILQPISDIEVLIHAYYWAMEHEKTDLSEAVEAAIKNFNHPCDSNKLYDTLVKLRGECSQKKNYHLETLFDALRHLYGRIGHGPDVLPLPQEDHHDALIGLEDDYDYEKWGRRPQDDEKYIR